MSEPFGRFGRRVKLSTVIRAPHRRLRTGEIVKVRLGDGSIVDGVVLDDYEGVARIGLDG